MICDFIINYKGISFEFIGTWIEHTPAKITFHPDNSSPEEGGYFEDYSIKVCNEDITDFLDNKVIEDIYNLAEKLKDN